MLIAFFFLAMDAMGLNVPSSHSLNFLPTVDCTLDWESE